MSAPEAAARRHELILLGTSDPAVSTAVSSALEPEPFVVVACALRLVPLRYRELRPALIILDAASRADEFVRTCRTVRSSSSTPIVALGGGGDASLAAWALDAGADDYVRTPLAAGELDARIRAVLRRTALEDDDRIAAGPLQMDESQHIAVLDGNELRLSATEFALLLLLLRHRNRVVTREDVLSHVWGADYGDAHHLLHVAMSRLRQKLGGAGRRDIAIQTIAGIGYRLAVEAAGTSQPP
jgi:DNA-binding response OmpR family regulator